MTNFHSTTKELTTHNLARAVSVLAIVLMSSSAAMAGDPWKKPFKKGGALSINKVHVPKRYQIKVKHPIELFPYCWGAPQDCRPVQQAQQEGNPQQQDQTLEPPQPYFVITRYICMSKRTGTLSGRDVSVTTRSATSCHDAATKAKSFSGTVGDPCMTANNEIDADQYVGSSSNVQAGMCAGF